MFVLLYQHCWIVISLKHISYNIIPRKQIHLNSLNIHLTVLHRCHLIFISYQGYFIFCYIVKWHRFWWKVISDNWKFIKNSPCKFMPGHWNFTSKMYVWSIEYSPQKYIFKLCLKILQNHRFVIGSCNWLIIYISTILKLNYKFFFILTE